MLAGPWVETQQRYWMSPEYIVCFKQNWRLLYIHVQISGAILSGLLCVGRWLMCACERCNHAFQGAHMERSFLGYEIVVTICRGWCHLWFHSLHISVTHQAEMSTVSISSVFYFKLCFRVCWEHFFSFSNFQLHPSAPLELSRDLLCHWGIQPSGVERIG